MFIKIIKTWRFKIKMIHIPQKRQEKFDFWDNLYLSVENIGEVKM